jgi:hypothetical protein
MWDVFKFRRHLFKNAAHQDFLTAGETKEQKNH